MTAIWIASDYQTPSPTVRHFITKHPESQSLADSA